MNIKNTVTKHYKKFFDLHSKGIELDEDDHLNIDWAVDLVKNCFIPDVIGKVSNTFLREGKTITNQKFVTSSKPKIKPAPQKRK